MPDSGEHLTYLAAWAVGAAASLWLAVVWTAPRLARSARHPRLARRLARVAPRRVRRAVEIALATAAVAARPVTVAAAPATPRSAIVVRDGSGDVATPVVRAPALPIAAAAPAPPPEPRASVHAVRPDDNLWLIARRTLIEAGNTRPADTEIARYWQIVIAANRATLRSGDPSLIFPGELVALPAPRLTQ